MQAEDTYKGKHSKSLPRTNEKILSTFFASNLATYFLKIIGTWVCDICIICKIYFDIIKEQIKNKNIKKIEVQILTLVVLLIQHYFIH